MNTGNPSSRNLAELKGRFESIYHTPPAAVVRAPGRVNLIGEHTDYNDGFVLPMAIEREVTAAVAPRTDRKVNLSSAQADQPAVIELTEPVTPGEPTWANYCKGVAAGLIEKGVELVGADILFHSTVPIGGGVSSSAALEVATAMALLEAASATSSLKNAPKDFELALICQKAENEFAGAPCGVMDQAIAVMARPGRAMLLDCRTGQVTHVPFDRQDTVILVADTQVTHDIGDGGYPIRRRQCETAADKLGVKALRDADWAMVAAAADNGKLEGKELMRARHIVTEIARTLEAVEALTAGNYELFGELMYDSHASCRDDFEISCEELNAIVELARPCEGVYGARMTGGGFGGCAIILADVARAEAIGKTVADGFAAKYSRRCPIFATRPAAGASVVE